MWSSPCRAFCDRCSASGRELLDELALAAAEALTQAIREGVGEDVRPGLVVSIATAGDLVQWHPHGHLITTDGGLSPDGSFQPMPAWDAEKLMKLFRQRLLDRLVAKKAISQELVKKLLCWRHPGFSAHVGEPIRCEDKKALEDLACYVVRSPLSLQKLVYLDGKRAVLYHGKMNPGLGRNFEAMDPLEWLARLADHIPDPGKHRVRMFGFYANRARGARAQQGARSADGAQPPEATPEAQGQKKRCPPSWARLIHKVYQADPLKCRSCGGKLRVVAYVSDPIAVRRIMQELGLSPEQKPKPPPAPSEVRRVPVDEEGREIVVP
jgi:hypothetical protein